MKYSANYRPWKEFVPKAFDCLFHKKYGLSLFKRDAMAGITVAVIALPLAMAFGIASGLTPAHGLFTAIVAGFLVSLFGGSRVQIGGPTGAFVVIIYDVLSRHGYGGLVFATLLAGLLLIIMGISRLGMLVKYIPYPLVTGLTTGIAIVLLSSQVKDFLGLSVDSLPADFLPKCKVLFAALPSWDPWALGVGAATLALVIGMRKYLPSAPWSIVSVIVATIVVRLFHMPVETVLSRYGPLPHGLPAPTLPHLSFDLHALHILIPDAITLAALAGVESLMSAVIADGLTGKRHKSNCELIAQGLANLGSSFFGGMPVSASFARTGTNIKSGAQTPVAGMTHALVLLLILYACAPIVSLIPLPALAAVLVGVAWQMSEVERLKRLLRAPFGDVCVLFVTMLLTVLIDVTTAVEMGVVIAACVFIKRMSDHRNVVSSTLFAEEQEGVESEDPDIISKQRVLPGIEVYEINGPLFFGVVDNLHILGRKRENPPKVLVLRMRKVPIIDASGLHALNTLHDKFQKQGTSLVLSGVTGSPLEDLVRFGLDAKLGRENILPHIDAALARAEYLLREVK